MARFLFRRVRLQASDWSLPAMLLVAALVPALEAGAEESALRPSIRDVTPSGIMRVYRAPGENDTSDVRTRQFDNIRVLADGSIRAGVVTISLFGIVLPARDKLCVDSTGARWACGMSAIGSLRNMIQSKSIICAAHNDDHGEADSDKFVGSCRIGQTDIGLVLLEQGWATLDQSVKERRYLEAAEYGRVRGLRLGTSALPKR